MFALMLQVVTDRTSSLVYASGETTSDGRRPTDSGFNRGRTSTTVWAWQAQARQAVITVAIRLRYDYNPTTMYRAGLLPFDAIRSEQKMNMSIFRRSRVVVESQL